MRDGARWELLNQKERGHKRDRGGIGVKWEKGYRLGWSGSVEKVEKIFFFKQRTAYEVVW